METVAELDEQSPDIVMDGVKNLLVVVNLLGALIFVFLALGYDIHKKGYIFAELLSDILYSVGGVFHYVVQEGGADCVGVQLQLFGRDGGDCYGVCDVGLSGVAFLAFVGVVCKLVGIFDFLKIFGGDTACHHVKDVLC